MLSGLLALLMVFTLAFGLVGCSSAGVESALDQAISRVEEVDAALETLLDTDGPCLLIADVAADISTED